MTPKLTVLLFSTALSVPFVTPLSAQSNSIACDNLNRVLSEDLTAPVLEMEADLRALVDQDNNQACLDALIDVNRELADSSDTDQVDLTDTSETTVTIEDEIVMEGTVFLDRQPPES